MARPDGIGAAILLYFEQSEQSLHFNVAQDK